jgi:glutaredoxin
MSSETNNNNNDSFSAEDSTPLVKTTSSSSSIQQQQETITVPKYAKRTIEMLGLDECGHCVDAETFFKTELTPNSDVPVEYRKISADSTEGQNIVDEKDLKYVPFIKECLIPTDPSKPPECQEVKGLKKNKFKFKVNSD